MQACLCDLCGSGRFKIFPQLITGSRYRVVVCKQCGLIYTNPRWDEQEIIRIYDEEFAADPGASALRDTSRSILAAKNAQDDNPSKKSASLSVITQHIDPKGKKWLEIRFRAGSLVKEVQRLGADVYGVDVFDNNVNVARERLNCLTLYSAPIYDLLAPIKGKYDVVSMMTIHVLAHVPSPTNMLSEIYERLVPGGMLILDEKDVTLIPPGGTVFPFQYPNGMAHYYHMTMNSTKAFVQKVGFEIIHADYFARASSLQHFVIVAKRPEAQIRPPANSIKAVDDPGKIYWHMVRTYARLRVRRKLKALKARL